MTFPLDIRTELKLGNAWSDISSDVYLRDPKRITRGIRDQGSTADPASLSLTLNNRAGKYSVRNAMSPLYGLIGRNTQVRVSVPATGDGYLNLDGLVGNSLSTPDVAPLDITGDLDVRVEMAANWYGAENQLVIGKWLPGQASWMVQLYDGVVYFRYTSTGTEATDTLAHARTLPALPERAALRVTLDVDNGSGQHTTTFYWATSLDGAWTQIGSPITSAGATPLFAGSAPLRIGLDDPRPNVLSPRIPMTGRVYRAEVRNGINGPVVASPDFRALADRTTSLNDSAGRVWSVVGGAEIRRREDRFVGEISTWPLKWTADASDIWTPVQADGILRRLGQGQKELSSTLRRRIPSGKPVAYWPMEESQDATRAFSPVAGVQPATVAGVEWAAASDLWSSAPLPQLTASASMSAPVPASMPSGEWQVEFVYNAGDKIPPANGPSAPVISVSSPNGTVRRWEVLMRAGAVRVWGYDAGGNDLANMNIGVGNDVFHGWTRMRLYAVDNGDGTFSFGLFFQDVGGDAGGLKGTITGTCGRVSAVTGAWGALTEGWGIGHLAVLPNAKSTLYDGSDDAYQGETAWQRLSRLGNEEGVSIGRIPGPLTPQRVGPQRPAKLVDLLEDVAESDGGWLTESPRRVGLTYRDRSSAYTQEPALTLSYTAPGLSDDLEPVDDDSDVTNDVTVTRDGGSSARAYLASGTLSVQSPPNGIGVYDTAKTLSLSDDTQPEPVANWLLHLGTYDGARYPVVTVWLHKPGAEVLVPQVLGLREGDVIRLTNLPSWLSHSDVDLIVQGWSETLDMYRWEISFNCAPGGPWNVAKAEHPTYGKADTDGTVLRTAVGVSDTSLFTQVTAGPMWTDAPKETPFDIEIAGERMRVDAVGALVTSENPYMETGIAGWSLENSTLSWDQTITHPRAKGSLKITPNGTSAVVGAAGTLSAVGTVIPGKSVRCGMWVYSPVALADVQPTIHFYNTAGTFISTGGLGTGYAVPAGQWTYLETVLASPALATRGRIRPRIGGTPTTPLYVWAPKAVTTDGLAVSDSFTRTAANGWGTADTGQTWSWYGSGTAANYDVTSNTGRHSIATRNVYRITALDGVNLADVETLVKVTVPGTYTGDGAYLYSLARADATLTNFYMARLFISTGNVATLSLRKRTPTETVLATATSTMTHVAGQSYNIRLSVVGSDLKARAWIAGQPEPAVWHVTATDTDPLIPASGTVGLRSFLATANTNTLPVVMAWDDFQITNAQRFAVTRSTNGVAKSHAAGESIALARSAVASL